MTTLIRKLRNSSRKTVASRAFLCYNEGNFQKGDLMLGKYLTVFLISMVPLVELRLAVPMAVGMGLPYIRALIVCVLGNMLPVPIIYLFARRVLTWGADKPYIGKLFRFFLEKGQRAGEKLMAKTASAHMKKL